MALGTSASGDVEHSVLRAVAHLAGGNSPGRLFDFSIEQADAEGFVTTFASTTVAISPSGRANLRLLIDYTSSPPKADLYVDFAKVLDQLPLPGTLPTAARRYFRGWKDSGYYRPADGSIDNFEADVYFRDPAVSCPVP